MKSLKKVTSIFLSSIFVLNTIVIPPTAIFADEGQEETKVDVITRATPNGTEHIEIDSEAEFADMFANYHTVAYPKDAIYSITTDLDMAGYTLNMMGDAGPGTRFTGIFSGEGHTISNLTITSTSDAAMFGNIGQNGIVEDIVFVNPTITSTNGSASIIAAENRGEIKRCSVINGTITGTTEAGALVANQTGMDGNSKITNCYADAATTVKGGSGVGGLAGTVTSTNISKCYSYAEVTGAQGVGGLVGSITSNTNITDCYTSVKVTATTKAAGGIAGEITNGGGTFKNLYTTALVTCNGTDSYAGSIIGRNGTYNTVGSGLGNIINCFSINPDIVGKKYLGFPMGRSNTPPESYVSTNPYWSKMTFNVTGSNTLEMGLPKNENSLWLEGTFKGAGWDFVNTWEWQETSKGGYPKLQGNDAKPYVLAGQTYTYPFDKTITSVAISPNSTTAIEYGKNIDVTLVFPPAATGKEYAISTSPTSTDVPTSAWVSVPDNQSEVKIPLHTAVTESGNYYIHWKTASGVTGPSPAGPYELDITKPVTAATATANSTTSVTVNLTPAFDAHSGVTDYAIFEPGEKFVDTMWLAVGSDPTATISQEFIDLIPNTLYTYNVIVKDKAGNVSDVVTVSARTKAQSYDAKYTPEYKNVWSNTIPITIDYTTNMEDKYYTVIDFGENVAPPTVGNPGNWVSIPNGTNTVTLNLEAIPGMDSGKKQVKSYYKKSGSTSLNYDNAGSSLPYALFPAGTPGYWLDIDKPTFNTPPVTITSSSALVSVTANAVDQVGLSGVGQYNIWNSTGTIDESKWQTSPTFDISGLAPNTTYTYNIQAKDNAGNLSEIVDFTFTTSAFEPASVTANPPSVLEWVNEDIAVAITASSMVDGQYIITNSITVPDASAGWVNVGGDITISDSSESYIHYKATSPTGEYTAYFGPYLLDKVPPTLEDSNITITPSTNSITTTLSASDIHSGVEAYSVQIETDTPQEPNWQDAETAISIVLGGLTPDTEYTLLIKVKDNAGNITETTKTVRTTSEVDSEYSITATPENVTTWSKDIDVTLNFTGDLTEKMYAVSNQNVTVPTDGWVSVADSESSVSIDLSQFESGEKYIYAKANNNGEEVLSVEPFGVYKLDKTAPTAQFVNPPSDSESNLSLTVSGTDEHSGASKYAILADSETLTEDKWQDSPTKTFTDLIEGQTYTFSGYVMDAAGNVSSVATCEVLIKVSDENDGDNGDNGDNGYVGNNGNNGNSGNDGNDGNIDNEANIDIDSGNEDESIPDPSTPSSNEDAEVIIEEEATPMGGMDISGTYYIAGYEDGTFMPDDTLSRAEFATILYNLTPEEQRINEGENFTDIYGDEWYFEEVASMSSAGVLIGYPDGSFMPEQEITRAEMATALVKFTGMEPLETESFEDVPVDHWANPYIGSLYANDDVSGYPDGTFRPDQYISRAEAVVMTNNAMGIESDENMLSEKENPFSDLSENHFAYYDILAVTE